MPTKDITKCFTGNSTIDISSTGGELMEVDANGNPFTRIIALKDGASLQCTELVEEDPDTAERAWLDGEHPTSIEGPNIIAFAANHKVYCGNFKEI